MYPLKVYINVCTQKLFVYAFILSGVHFLSLNTMTVGSTILSPETDNRHSLTLRKRRRKEKGGGGEKEEKKKKSGNKEKVFLVKYLMVPKLV